METRRMLLNDRYELLGLLATGGMGQVWRAHDTLLHRQVAVKVLRSEFTGNASFLARFRAEAQHTACLAHPNIAALYDYGELRPGPDGSGEHLAYLVMELVDGEPLSDLLAREGRLDADRTLAVVRQTAAGLAAAHAAGVVHRDVKPGNVLVGRDGTVKITDFGIAWSASSVPLTQTGQVVGTAHYLAPEQAQGAKATPASDVYALGTVAYECLAGRRAFEGENSVQIALKQIREEPLPLPADVPAPVRALVERAMVKDPEQRYPDGAAVRDAVDELLGGRPLPRLRPAPELGPGNTAAMPALPFAGPLADPFPGPLLAAPERPRSRSMAGRVLVAALALLAVAAVAVVVHGTGGADAAATSAGSGRSAGSATTAGAAATSAPPSPTTVPVTAGDYIGHPVTDVQAQLSALGLQVQLVPIQTSDVAAGQVIALDPVGELAPGQAVTVTFAVAPAPAAPVGSPQGSGGGNGGGNGHGHGDGKGHGGKD